MHSCATDARTKIPQTGHSSATSATRASFSRLTFCTTSMSMASRACLNAPLVRRASDSLGNFSGTSVESPPPPTLLKNPTSATCVARAIRSHRRSRGIRTPTVQRSHSNAPCVVVAFSLHRILFSTAATRPAKSQ